MLNNGLAHMRIFPINLIFNPWIFQLKTEMIKHSTKKLKEYLSFRSESFSAIKMRI